MSKRLTTNEFIDKAIAIHGDKYNYSLVDYVDSKTKVTIICKKHGVFKQIPTDHYGKRGCGCIKCGYHLNTRNIGLDGFINKARKLHGDKYDYSNSIYINYDAKIDIECKEHGIFNQYISNHLAGNGCPSCSYELKHGSYAPHNRGVWENKIGYFYNVVLEHNENTERFNKVGITITPDRRFQHYRPYILSDILELTEMKLGEAFDKEQKFIKTMNKYTPLEKFSGYTECYRN